ncbi:hypothetical protein DFS33DRAFT_403317 [Desarmillaria ectypa]|nr:hypothetical protein DFS33DRAFT_403317 [Desarmillaria ectypa]
MVDFLSRNMIPTSNITDLSLKYPDDESEKRVYLQARSPISGSSHTPRHFWIFWDNGGSSTAGSNMLIHQIIQLERDKAQELQTYELGTFTRDQREKMLELAADIQFNERLLHNGCRVWTRKLLGAMVNEGLLDRMDFVALIDLIPLPYEQPEYFY